MTEDTADSTDAVYRVTVFLNNGARVMFNTKDEDRAGFVRRRFSFENLKSNNPVELKGFEEQKLIFVPSSISMVIQERVRHGMEYFNDPLDRFVYHTF